MNANWKHCELLGGKLTLVGLTAVLAAACTGPAFGDKMGNFEIQVLQPGNDGAGSRATSVATGDVNGDGFDDIIIGGSFMDPDTNAEAPCLFQALVTNEQVKTAKFEFLALPTLGHGGRVNAITVPGNAGDDAIEVCAAGFANDGAGKRLPVFFAKYIDRDGRVVQLPTPDDAGGEALGIMAEWHGGNLIIVVCGKIVRSDGTEQACTWECTFEDGNPDNPIIQITELGSLSDLGDAAANVFMTYTLTNSMISGYSADDAGNPQAVYWEKTDNGWQAPQALMNLPGGSESQALGGVTDGTSNTLMFSGMAKNRMGKVVPTIWDAGEYSPSIHVLRLLPGFNQGRANGIIAILIGLLVPGEMSGPNGSIAALWTVNDNGGSMPLNLNALARGKPRGTTLRSAIAILPYMEQEGLFVIGGQATNRRGVSHGYVGFWNQNAAGSGMD